MGHQNEEEAMFLVLTLLPSLEPEGEKDASKRADKYGDSSDPGLELGHFEICESDLVRCHSE